jgi:polyphosphate kinase
MARYHPAVEQTGDTTRPRTAPEGLDARLFNREASWVVFNDRVLQLAADPAVPLLERIRFCTIYASNLDEFFMVRVAGLIDHVHQGTTPSDGSSPERTLDRIAERCRLLQVRLEDLLVEDLLPALELEGIELVALERCTSEERDELQEVFERQVFPVLTPLAVGPGQPFPYISNLSLSVGISVRDPVSGEFRFARVKVPEVLPRLLRVGHGDRFVRLREVIADGHWDAVADWAVEPPDRR